MVSRKIMCSKVRMNKAIDSSLKKKKDKSKRFHITGRNDFKLFKSILKSISWTLSLILGEGRP